VGQETDRPCLGLRREEARRGSGIVPSFTRAELESIAAQLARGYPEVEAVFLFGSLARGNPRPGSDVDLAVLLRPGSSLEERLCLGVEMGEYVEDLIGLPADVVVLHPDLHPSLLFDIFRIETILFALDRDRAHELACQARREYRDLLPRLERAFRRIRRDIAEWGHAAHRA